MTRPGRYPEELRERAVRLVFEHQIDAFSRFIVGWQAARSLRTDLAWTP